VQTFSRWALAALLLTSAASAPAQVATMDLSGADAPGQPESSSSLWLYNVGSADASVQVMANSVVTGDLDVPGRMLVRLDRPVATSVISAQGSADLLWVRSSNDLMATSIQVYAKADSDADLTAAPAWLSKTVAATRNAGRRIHASETARAVLAGAGTAAADDVVRASVASLTEGATVDVRLVSASGEVLRSVTVAAPPAVNWRVDLGRRSAGTYVDFEVVTGEAACTVSVSKGELEAFVPATREAASRTALARPRGSEGTSAH